MTAWPGIVWGAAILRGLDDRGRREIEAAGTLHEKRTGETLYADGDAADAVYVVAKGEIEVSGLSRGERARRTKRKALAGDALGEEALLGAHAVRDGGASCAAACTVAEVPFGVLLRALVRAGGAELKDRTARAVRRRLLEQRLRTSGLLEGLDDGAVGTLLDAAAFREVARGEVIAGPSDPHDHALSVLEGLLGIQESDEDGRLSPVGYVGRGDMVHDPRRATFGVTVSAQGPSSVVLLPKARIEALFADGHLAADIAHRGLLPEARVPTKGTTAHLVGDLYRVQIARSLLVIDQDACVRCGHCVWSCGNAHDDGAPRLTRRGDKLLLPILDDRARPATREAAQATHVPLLLPNSCQHCKNPACLKDCPTGAIVRDGRGEVRIREELCTGCGNCARGCPWENIQIVPRAKTAEKPPFPDVAVKCDLCSDKSHGPACVSACPTEAIVRIDPSESPLVGQKAGTIEVVPRGRVPAWPWMMLAVGVGLAASRLVVSSRGTGLLAGAVALVALVYLGKKRAKPRGKARGTRPHYVAHLAVGTLATALAFVHVRLGGSSPSGVVALVTFVALALSGFLAALAYVTLPPMLSRLEREGRLPEDLPRIREEHARKLFRALSGRTELVKKVYDRVLAPYRASRLGPLALVASRRSLGAEERALSSRIDALLEGRGKGKLAGLDALLRLVVEERALAASVWLSRALRGLPVIHVATVGTFVVALVVHAVLALRGGR